MVKSEQIGDINNFKRGPPIRPELILAAYQPAVETTSIVTSQRSIDIHALDISSIKGRFAWEKIAIGDTYIPIIFRGTTKLFCTTMLRKLLAEHPKDIIRRASNYQYRRPIALYAPTANEIVLLNKINSQHCNWAFSSSPFNLTDELVCVAEFLPFYEYLHTSAKTTPDSQSTSATSLRSIASQTQQAIKPLPAFHFSMSDSLHEDLNPPVVTKSVPINRFSASELLRDEKSSLVAIRAEPTTSTPYPSQPPKHGEPPSALPRQIPQPSSTQSQQNHLIPLPNKQQRVTSSKAIINSTNTVLPNKFSTTVVVMSSSQSPTPTVPMEVINSSTSDPISSSLKVASGQKLSTLSTEKQFTPISRSSSSPSSSSTLKTTRLNSGWLQINKLYTPYVSSTTSNHHLYKIPISLLTFYDLLKTQTPETNANASKDVSTMFEQTLVTPQEIELINELCLKQSIKPFSIDIKLMDLLTFYKYCSTNILFIKELPLNEPKASICKEWASIVQINGGICRLRNITTLHEQTVPFIGNSLLKNFIISSQCLSSALLTTPTPFEMEFLQLILFFSNMSINLQNSKLIDIESVRKEYTVDLILLFNDKFPLNVLNYQHQTKEPSTSQRQFIQSDSLAATNTFAESTPPPSPISPTTNNNSITSTSQLPLTSTSYNPTNRFQKQIIFHGHSMTAYICSGLESNTQRECISVQALCNMLYPNSSMLDKLEVRMLRLLRMKKINRFRPQNQQSISFTRLVDIQDIENHWDYIEKGMHSLSNNNEEIKFVQITPPLLDKDLKASTADKTESNSNSNAFQQENSIEVNQNDKRPLESATEEDTHIFKRIYKCGQTSPNDSNEQSNLLITDSTEHIDQTTQDKNDDDNKPKTPAMSNSTVKTIRLLNDQPIKKKIFSQRIERIPSNSSLSSRKQRTPIKKKIKLVRSRRTPGMRTRKQSIATWFKKYQIEDFCICLDFYNPLTEI
ncbi:unnamed protein product [Rotaria magnacalcarata]|nr:unnamed protein product [Rotaria magnacalcarata]CAF2094215.1 unnamed protein product [Rotaria magnacalcarata]